jgi:hypothetical protein
MPEASEGSHLGHPDFRVRGKIFATLGFPGDDWAMVKLTPEQQRALLLSGSESFTPVKGAWGRRGCTNVRLDAVDEAVLRRAMAMAWRHNAPKKLAESHDDDAL